VLECIKVRSIFTDRAAVKKIRYQRSARYGMARETAR